MATTVPVTMDTLITIKISIQGSNRKFKIPMRDLGAGVLPGKLRQLLNIPSNQDVVFERFSDSAGAYITLDPENPQVYKTLFRAAKAKLKLRLRATIVEDQPENKPVDTFQSILEAGKAMPPIPLPVRTAPALPPQPQPQAQPQATSPPPPQPGPTNTGTIPLYPYARLPAFHKTNMRASNTPPVPAPAPTEPERPVDAEGEAPVPKPFSARDTFFSELANMSRERELALRMKESTPATLFSWSVYCNVCDKPMSNEHYHCSICDEGDYDLCENCVASGHHCPGEGHWLIKRFIKNGKVTNSTTERVAPKPTEEPEPEPVPEVKVEPEEKEMPGAFTTEKFMAEKKPEPVEPEQPTRTCNSCVKVFPERNFVTCVDCEDYDLCMSCHVGSQHGHHPGHAFKPAEAGTIGPLAEFLCAPGRNVRHAAVCDGCEKFIYGVRHKCLNCPDWDYCAECIKGAKQAHPMHRFVPIFDPLPEPRTHSVRHFGIYCDGPLCKDKMNQTYIEGVRYKCAVCYDTDFCANCEAHPSNRHNRTHPTIKFKTPVRNVSVTTMGEDKNGAPLPNLGDVSPRRPSSVASASANAATQVRTIADLKPSEDIASKSAKVQIKDLLAEPIDEKIQVEDLLAKAALTPKSPEPVQEKAVVASDLQAHFIRDTIYDGTKIPGNSKFLQVWTLRNPGPHAWPAGCSVRYVGGDNMLNVNNEHPCSTTDIAEATESNVIGRVVAPGEEISFSVLMKAPAREGVCISYWRLKTADGTPFGHRLWCHIETTTPIPAPLPVESPQSTDAERTLARLRELRERRQSRVQETENHRTLQREAMQAMVSRMQRLHEAQEQMKQRQKVLRAELAQKQAERVAAAPPKPTVEDAPEAESSEVPVKQETEVKQEAEAKPEPSSSEGSQMIFPTLEKESPVNSTHVSSPPVEADKATNAPSSVRDETEIFEDAETVDLVSSDDGFLTDEEYDVLDASDSEFPA